MTSTELVRYQPIFFGAGFAGLLAGETSTDALIAAHVIGRSNIIWLFNSPGSEGLYRSLHRLAKSHFSDGLHGGISVNPLALTTRTTSDASKYIASQSGTVIPQAGEIAQVLFEISRKQPSIVVPGRVTTPTAVTIVDLHRAGDALIAPRAGAHGTWIALLPIAASALAVGATAYVDDWVSCAAIALGMAANGAASLVLGRAGTLVFTRPEPAPGAPAGDGYIEGNNEILVLRGSEAAVSAVTRGRFALRFSSERRAGLLAHAATLFAAQCVAQLLAVPLGTVFGQICFLLTIGVAWLCSAHIAANQKKTVQRVVMEDVLQRPETAKYALGTRAATAAFVVAQLKPRDVEGQLRAFIPNDTPVWVKWRQSVARAIRSGKATIATVDPELEAGLGTQEQTLLRTLLQDAQDAFNLGQKY